MRKELLGIGTLVLLTVAPGAVGTEDTLASSITPACPARVYHGQTVALKTDVRPFLVQLSPGDGIVSNDRQNTHGYFDFLDKRPNPEYPKVRSKDLWVYAVTGQAQGCYLLQDDGGLTVVV